MGAATEHRMQQSLTAARELKTKMIFKGRLQSQKYHPQTGKVLHPVAECSHLGYRREPDFLRFSLMEMNHLIAHFCTLKPRITAQHRPVNVILRQRGSVASPHCN